MNSIDLERFQNALGEYPNLHLIEEHEPSVIDSKIQPIVRELRFDINNTAQDKSISMKKDTQQSILPEQQQHPQQSSQLPLSTQDVVPPDSEELHVLSEPMLRRSLSLPSLGRRSVSVGRRSIFGNYWENKSKSAQDLKHSHQGLASLPHITIPEGVDWHHFSLPPAPVGSIRHVPLIDTKPLTSRTASDGSNGSISSLRYKIGDADSRPSATVSVPATRGGAYPLCLPRSILRRRSNTLSSTSDPTHILRFLKVDAHHRRDESESSSELPFALTKSIKQLQRKQVPGADDNDDEEEDTVSSSCSSSYTRRVQFSPIVMVTEFEEDDKRQWLTERELSKFQHDAIVKARSYLLSRPKMAEEYNQLKLCSVTGTMRKKALFSLPALSSIVEDCLPKAFSPEFQRMSEKEMRNILIVEPNKTVRDLFCRCLHSVFPWARILGALSGEEAVKVIGKGLSVANGETNGGCVPIDLMIIAEKLSRYRQAPSPVTGADRKTADTTDHGDAANASSVITHTPPGMTSYELLRQVCDLEENAFGKQCSDQAREMSADTVRRPLLIAVTLNLAKDADQLKASGADVVWGIPPPTPCIALRNELVFALISKRRFNVEEC
jgi:CheY-like chemotaxis protein